MDITRSAISNRTVTVVIVVLLMAGGLYSYFHLPQSEDPGFTVRAAQVITVYPGASSERVRDLVTRPLEDAINELGEIDVMTSQSKTGVSIITVTIKFEYKDLEKIWGELSDAVDSVKGDLPDGIIGPRVEDNYGDVFSIMMGITGEGYSAVELGGIAEEVRRELLHLSEVSRVDIYGVPDEEVVVRYNRHTLQNLGLTPYHLANAIQKTNIVRPGGKIESGREDISIEPSGNITSVSLLGETLVNIPGTGDIVPLRDLSDISEGPVDPPGSYVRYNGSPAVVLAINMKDDGRMTVMGDQVRDLADRLLYRYPIGVDFSFMAFQPDIVSSLVRTFTMNVIQAIIVVMLVMVLAAGLRSGLVAASLVPTTMIGTLLILNVSKIWINQMSLAALIIVLGMLVDSAIVMIENMRLEIKSGVSPVEAAVMASKELKVSLLTSALTTAAAFLPIAMAQNPAGEYTRPLFYVVTIALLLAWVLTITLVPLLGVKLLPESIRKEEQKNRQRVAKGKGSFEEKIRGKYIGFLTGVLRKRWLMVSVLVIVLIGSLGLFRSIPVSFFPTTSYSVYTMKIALPRGTSIGETSEVASEIESFLDSEFSDMIEDYSTFIGGGVPRFRLNISPDESRPEYAFFLVNVKSPEVIDTVFAKTRTYVSGLEPDAELQLDRYSYGPGSSAAVEIRLSGSDRTELYRNVEMVKKELAARKGVVNIRDNWGIRSKTLEVETREASARRVGITHQDVAVSLQAASLGLTVSEYRGGGESLPIVLRDGDVRRNSVDDIASTLVFSEATGAAVPLRQVADINVSWKPSVIIQRDGLETITVQADMLPGLNAISVTGELDAFLQEESRSWPVGTSYSMGGEFEGSRDANKAIMDQLPLALFIIILLLVIQFNSLKRTLIILITIPFGFIGVVFGLWVTGSTFSFMSLLGLVSLSGVVVNNAIILLERIEYEQTVNGKQPLIAVYRASVRKFRPIILTSVTTITGLLPLLFFGGPLWLPMAAALVFGLAFATILTLGLIPVLYTLLFRLPRPDGLPSEEEIL